MKKKRKICIPAATYGLGTDWDLLRNVGTNVVNNLPDVVNTLSTPFQKSTATTSGEAWAQSIGDIANGASTGFKVAGLPGAVVGATFSAIGRKAVSPHFNTFVSGDKGNRPTGARALFGGTRAWKKEVREFERNLYNNKAAVQGTNYLRSEYAEEDPYTNTALFAANGGLTGSLVALTSGEYVEGPDGTISIVPGTSKTPDDKIAEVEPGTKVISNKLKVPGSKETPAELFEKMATKKKSKFNDRFAENAAKLNEMNNNQIFDRVFALQEAVKKERGIKPKTKQLMAAFDNGGVNKWAYGDDFKYLRNGKYDEGYLNWIRTGLTQDILDRGLQQNPEMFSRFRRANRNYSPTVELAVSWSTDYKPSDFHKFAGWMYDNRESLSTPTGTTATNDNTLGREYQSPIIMGSETKTPKSPTQAVNTVGHKRADNTGGANIKTKGAGKDNGESGKTPFNWSSALSGLASLAPIMYNLFAKPEIVDPVYNPYTTAINNTMRRRRFDINPAMQDVLRNRAINNDNIRLMNTSTGANLAYSLASAVNTNKAIANLRSAESNMNNQYSAEYANAMNDLGKQWVAATNLADDLNAQNRATARNMIGAGLSGSSERIQKFALDRMLERNDERMWPLYKEWLESAFADSALAGFNKTMKKYA